MCIGLYSRVSAPGQKRRRRHSSDDDKMESVSLPSLTASLSRHTMQVDPNDAHKYQVTLL